MTLHELLKEVARKKADSICFSLQDVHAIYYTSRYVDSATSARLGQLISEWPEHSGNVSYPVPCPNAPEDLVAAHATFWQARRTGTLWSGPYGASRQRLLDYLLERTKP